MTDIGTIEFFKPLGADQVCRYFWNGEITLRLSFSQQFLKFPLQPFLTLLRFWLLLTFLHVLNHLINSLGLIPIRIGLLQLRQLRMIALISQLESRNKIDKISDRFIFLVHQLRGKSIAEPQHQVGRTVERIVDWRYGETPPAHLQYVFELTLQLLEIYLVPVHKIV